MQRLFLMAAAIVVYIVLLGLATVHVQWEYDGDLTDFKLRGLLGN